MANVIEIIIKANDQASAGLAKADAAAAGLNSRLKMLATVGFAAVAGAALGAVTAMAGAAAAYGSQVEQLSNLAKQTGSTVAEVQVLGAAFEEAGLGAGTADAALKRLSVAIGQNDPILKRLGITSRNSYEALLQLADVFPRMKDQADRSAVALALLGRGGREADVVMDGLRARVGQLNTEIGSAGGLITKDAEAIALASDAISDYVKRRTDAMKNQLGQFATLVQVSAFAQFDAFLSGAAGGSRKGPLKVPGIEVSAKAPAIKTQAQIDAEKAAADAQLKASLALSEFLQSVRRGGLSAGGEGRGLMGGDGRGILGLSGPANDPGTRFTDTGDKINKALDRTEQRLAAFGSNLESAFSRTFASLTQITSRSNNILVQLFTDLANAITQTITEMLAKLAAQELVRFGASIIGAFLNPASAAAPDRAIPVAGDFGARGSTTYNINTLSPASVLGELTGVTGSFRVSNSRVGELRRALG